jgi:DNA primase small subunit
MNDFSTRVAQDYFKKYYEGVKTFGIRQVEKREMAFSSFGKQGMVRHTSFPNMEELREYVLVNVPLHFYYSSAYYDHPTANMENKRWKGADLVFDIDGDHIEGADRMGYAQMLSLVKEELKKLLNLLVDDLNVSKQDLEIVFSGSRGYHVHVYSIFEGLESQERREIVDYISGRCIAYDLRSAAVTRWQERINAARSSLLQILDSPDRKWRQKLEEVTGETTGDKGKKEIRKDGYLDRNAKKIAIRRYSSKIDEPVTIDIHRLIRVPGSLHGKTALMVKILEYDKIDSFDPLAETIPDVFQDMVQVNLSRKMTFEFLNRNEEITEGRHSLPVYAALFSVLKGSAEFVDDKT